MLPDAQITNDARHYAFGGRHDTSDRWQHPSPQRPCPPLSLRRGNTCMSGMRILGLDQGIDSAWTTKIQADLKPCATAYKLLTGGATTKYQVCLTVSGMWKTNMLPKEFFHN